VNGINGLREEVDNDVHFPSPSDVTNIVARAAVGLYGFGYRTIGVRIHNAERSEWPRRIDS
jgi:hypothetical protein